MPEWDPVLTSRTSIRVRYAETDQMGVAYHGSFVPWLEQARIELLDLAGVPYRELEAEDALLPVLELSLRYHTPARFDDRLAIEASVPATTPRARIRIDYRVFREEAILATGYTLHAFINREGRPIRPPERFVAAFSP